MTAILGISAYYHDSAAVLLVDGEIKAAAQEERFTRRKQDADFPVRAVDYCLSQAGLQPEQIDYVGFYEKPLLKFDRLLETYLAYAPRGFNSFRQAMPLWLKQKLFLPREMNASLRKRFNKRYVFCDHHESHAASAFFPSPFEEAAILTLDGVGEWATATIGVGRGNKIELTHEMRFPHSLGLLYSAFTYFCGFKVNSGEYKLMGLAPYGEPIYYDLILDKLVDLKEDGSFLLRMEYFDYGAGLTMTNNKFAALFNGPPRQAETLLTQREMDIAASIQKVTEEIMLRTARFVHQQTGMRNLCLAGGVALNCVANGRILREGPFQDLWIQPAAGDAGGALGVATLIWHQLLGKERPVLSSDRMQGAYLGPHFSSTQIEATLKRLQAVYRRIEDETHLADLVSDYINDGKVIGWFQGRMEFGPRALGARSIIGDARNPQMQSTMNLKIKFRESFRPFAPAVLRERVADFFDTRSQQESPYMLLVAPVHEKQRLPQESSAPVKGIDKLKQLRSLLPAITHVDYSARIQTVDAERHGRYYRALKAFEAKTGCGVIINTSFNVRGEPIVCTPTEAYRCFMLTDIDVLVLEDCVLLKSEQPQVDKAAVDSYLREFKLD